MAKYLFHVVGLRYHDFKDRLDELYARAEGKSMSLHLEAENVMEENAVMVYLLDKFVGYVSTDERALAEGLLASGRGTEVGKVIEIDREHRIITMEVDTDVKVELKGLEKYKELLEWHYDGHIMQQTREEISLKVMEDKLKMYVEQQSEWNDEMQTYLDFIGDNLWCDAGSETKQELDNIKNMLIANSEAMKGYKEAAAKLIFYTTDVNSPEQRQRQVDFLYEQSKSEDMRFLLDELGDRAEEAVKSIPSMMRRLFDHNPQEYIGRLRYLPFEYKQTRELNTLMAMRIALKSQREWKMVDVNDVLVGGEETLQNLAFVIDKYYQGSQKNMALIYCVLRDNGLLVNRLNYRDFVYLIKDRDLLPWMSDKKLRSLVYSISQYMNERKDHNRIRRGFGENYMSWDECKERLMCEEIAEFFTRFEEK